MNNTYKYKCPMSQYIQEFALAAVFDHRLTEVALILKQRAPKGLETQMIHYWNGLGGHVESDIDRNHRDCIMREIQEESNLIVSPDHIFHIGYIKRPGKFCSVWTSAVKNKEQLAQTTDELVSWHHLSHLPDNLDPDMVRILPYAVSDYRKGSLGIPLQIKDFSP